MTNLVLNEPTQHWWCGPSEGAKAMASPQGKMYKSVSEDLLLTMNQMNEQQYWVTKEFITNLPSEGQEKAAWGGQILESIWMQLNFPNRWGL